MASLAGADNNSLAPYDDAVGGLVGDWSAEGDPLLTGSVADL